MLKRIQQKNGVAVQQFPENLNYSKMWGIIEYRLNQLENLKTIFLNPLKKRLNY